MGKDLKGKELGKNLSQRKDGRYEAKYTDNFGKRHSIYGEKLSDVRKKLVEALYKVNNGLNSKNTNLKLDDWYDIWLKTYKEGNIRETSLNRCKRYYKNNISPFLGFMYLKQIKQIHIQNMINKYQNELHLSKSTQNRLISIIKSIFGKAVDNELILKSPAKNLVRSSEAKEKERHFLTEEEQILFLEYAKKYSYYNLYIFMLYTGVRIGEALALEWEDICFEKNIVKINKTYGIDYDYVTKKSYCYTHNPKTKTSCRDIPLHKDIATMLHVMKNIEYSKDNKCNFVFHTKNNTRIEPKDVWNGIKVIVKKINTNEKMEYKKIHPHSLRHTFATNCFESDIPAKVVQSFLGHASLKMTMDLYTHVSEDNMQEKIQLLKSNIDLIRDCRQIVVK